MGHPNHTQIIKDYYRAYANGDRELVENTISDNFTFSAPPDPLLTRETYFERCWPGSGRKQNFDFKRMIEHGDEVIVTYEMDVHGTDKGRNTEIFTFESNKVTRVEDYFGWSID